ncbi:hypothetical protein [Enterococcus sp. BWR-S5]|uniref:hypothetical protein n=1 Tax=Enterococcus sp. BWR-S5 TaxID=2787714 RepID=UPI001924BE0C|nr:hypothetical protein [Enterococcus sp. BWR-S5]MBL1227515.1 hypothetical protein [Enterococcus sp. BWR-S5]
MKRVVRFAFASLLVMTLTACGSSKKTDYEIKDGDPLELLEEAGYSLTYSDSYNASTILENVEEKITIEFELGSDDGEIWNIRYTNKKDKIEERVSSWGIPTENRKTIARYVDSIRSTGITTQTVWNLISDYSAENNPEALINKTKENKALKKNTVGQLLVENGYTFYTSYEAYDSGAYNLDINVSNLETGIGYQVGMYEGKFYSLDYTNLSEKVFDEKVYSSGKHSGEEKTIDLYLESLEELDITKEEFMKFFSDYQDAYFKAVGITPGEEIEGLDDDTEDSEEELEESSESTKESSSEAKESTVESKTETKQPTPAANSSSTKTELEDIIEKYDELIDQVNGFSSNPSTYTLAAYGTFMTEYTELLTMFNGLDSLANSSDSEVVTAYTRIIEKNTALSLALTKLPSEFAS